MKKRIIIIHITILMSIFFISCEKNKDSGDFIIKGKVINIGSNKPIDSVLVILYGGNPLSNPFMPDFNNNPPNGNNDTAYSNKNGEFYLKVRNESAAFLGWIKDGYKNGNIVWYSDNFQTKSDESGNKFFRPGNRNIIIEYKAECTFNPVFKKNGINSVNDTLVVTISPSGTSEFPHAEGFEASRYPTADSYFGRSPFVFNHDGGYCNGDFFFHYKLDYTDSGIWKTKIDSVYVASHETYSDTIYYE